MTSPPRAKFLYTALGDVDDESSSSVVVVLVVDDSMTVLLFGSFTSSNPFGLSPENMANGAIFDATPHVCRDDGDMGTKAVAHATMQRQTRARIIFFRRKKVEMTVTVRLRVQVDSVVNRQNTLDM